MCWQWLTWEEIPSNYHPFLHATKSLKYFVNGRISLKSALHQKGLEIGPVLPLLANIQNVFNMVVRLHPFSSFLPRRYPIAIFWTIKEVFLPFLFKYYLFSHFPDEIEPLFHIIPSLFGYKNHIFPQTLSCFTKIQMMYCGQPAY